MYKTPTCGKRTLQIDCVAGLNAPIKNFRPRNYNITPIPMASFDDVDTFLTTQSTQSTQSITPFFTRQTNQTICPNAPTRTRGLKRDLSDIKPVRLF